MPPKRRHSRTSNSYTIMKKIQLNPQIIFLIIGLLLLGISYLLVTNNNPSESIKFWASVFQNFSFIILTIVTINFLWQLLGGEPIEKTLNSLKETLGDMRSAVLLLQDSKTTGLHRTFSIGGAYGSHEIWMKRLHDAKERIDLMGYTLFVWTKGENFEEVIKAKVISGLHIRVVTMDDENHSLGAFVNEEQIISLSMNNQKEENRLSKKVFTSIATSLSGRNDVLGSFQFKTLKKGIITTQICRTDSQITSIQYLYTVIASRSPLFEVVGSDTTLFKLYMSEFDKIWELAVVPPHNDVNR